MDNRVETAIRFIIIAACVCVSVYAVVDFYESARAYNKAPILYEGLYDPVREKLKTTMMTDFAIHIASSAVAIYAAGEYAMLMLAIALLPIHGAAAAFVFVLSVTLIGIIGMGLFVIMYPVTILSIVAALIVTAGLGLALSIHVEDISTSRPRR